MPRKIYSLSLIIIAFTSLGLAPVFEKNSFHTNSIPKVIRTCCSFGANVGVAGLPFIKISEITDTNSLGPHKFFGEKNENNGIIYTRNGGFIDTGHLRDIADVTAFLYVYIKEHRHQKNLPLKLANEAGQKTLEINIPDTLKDPDLLLIAGKLAYDLSVWHEISTWYGASYIPLVPERYSSFSVEDAYSNLLGVHLGMQAITAKEPYDMAMTKLIAQKLSLLQAVGSKEQTMQAMEAVKNVWWTNNVKLPNKDVLILRQFDLYSSIKPILVYTPSEESKENFDLNVPSLLSNGEPIDIFYKLNIRPNYKIPTQQLFGYDKAVIQQTDFPKIVGIIKNENTQHSF
jgi:hypothetical protein